ncbi:hypothetical protein SDC9_160587 [bioreactor metagenome]|uniref:Uncharacterized protein n=1 Tax=bioreactor metagenome TaxID=1076179 RepID=A0A645FI15_9ZZZZ
MRAFWLVLIGVTQTKTDLNSDEGCLAGVQYFKKKRYSGEDRLTGVTQTKPDSTSDDNCLVGGRLLKEACPKWMDSNNIKKNPR